MSTIKVDTLQTRSGNTAAVTGAGFVATDQIRGNTAANSVTVVAEGGSTTTNLQQGLAKQWTILTGTSTVAIENSFNNSSIADLGTGHYRNTYSNNYSNIDYIVTGSNIGSTASAYYSWVASDGGIAVTSSIDVLLINGEGNMTVVDQDVVQVISHGDLA